MKEKINNIKTKMKNIFKKDNIKKIFLLSCIIILIYVILLILATFLVDGLIAENKIRQKEIDRLYKEGKCNYDEPCNP